MPGYTHRDNAFFRLGSCSVCGQPTYHKPVEHARPSGRMETRWECEGCGSVSPIIERVENELELFVAYVRERYFGK